MIAEIGRATPTFDDGAVDRLDRPVPHAADEVRAALAWSRRAADRECDLAEQLVHDLPQVYAAFLAGDIDRSKARVLADHLAGLTPTRVPSTRPRTGVLRLQPPPLQTQAPRGALRPKVARTRAEPKTAAPSP